MKRYRCHKVVEAAEIVSVQRTADLNAEQSAVHTHEHGMPVSTPVGEEFFARGEPQPGDYLVRYQPDGYLSWSPKAVFEDGYREMGQYEKG